ncbi:alpha/beta hydrolase family protein [Leifsonia sp. AG29]|uniref:alpha/beta hydrolase family protein n=1 Tax=Leifsonia sp. AG29 TaxID=2598860 RepID=UPI00131DAFA9|nr:alpha/beta family hydrolase [Leifsonia sp. AG29]
MQVVVATSHGDGRLVVSPATRPIAGLWLGHGAGGGIEARDLAELAAGLPARGISVVRYEQPWRVACRRVAARPATLDEAWVETAPRVRELIGDAPLVAGGRSAGARVACRTAAQVDAAAVVCLAFPLHPPGRPEKSRLEELLTPTVPVLVLQGERDTFGSADTVAREAAGRSGIRVVPVPGADHGMKVLASSAVPQQEALDLVTRAVADFVAAVV